MTVDALTTEAVTILSPFFTKGMEGAAGEAGKALWKWVSEKLKVKNKKNNEESLKEGWDNVDSLQVKNELQHVLTENIDLIPELENLLVQAKAEKNITVQGVYQNHTGTGHNISGTIINIGKEL